VIPPKLYPDDLTEEELLDIVTKVTEILWPIVMVDYSATTAENIANVLADYHLDP